MDAPGVVPLRAGFDVEFRGYSRKQVLEHIELLEDQLRMIAIDRDESTKLNTHCRQVCEDLRTELDEARARLARIESSSSGIPQAMQGMQNMLSMAEDEADTIRQRAERYAETVRGTADTDARQIRADAEVAASEVRAECEQLVVELEARRDRINAEHGAKIDALHARAHDLRLTIQREYEQKMEQAKAEAAEVFEATRNRCAEADAETERRRAEMERQLADRRAAALDELADNRTQLDEWRRELIVMLCNSRSAIDASVATVTAHGAVLEEQSETWMRVQQDARTAAGRGPTDSPTDTSTGAPESAKSTVDASDQAAESVRHKDSPRGDDASRSSETSTADSPAVADIPRQQNAEPLDRTHRDSESTPKTRSRRPGSKRNPLHHNEKTGSAAAPVTDETADPRPAATAPAGTDESARSPADGRETTADQPTESPTPEGSTSSAVSAAESRSGRHLRSSTPTVRD